MARTYHVPAISCGHCKDSIETALGDVDGITGVEVDVDARDVHVEGDASDDDVTSALDEIGFEVATDPAG